MKRLIYQVYIGNRKNLYDTCVDSVKRYCEKYNIEHKVQTKPILKIKPNIFQNNRPPHITRLGYLPILEKENAFDLLPEYDQIAIIDSDVYITENAPNIFDFIDDESSFAGVPERDLPLTAEYAQIIRNYSDRHYKDIAGKSGSDFEPNSLGYEYFNMGVMVLNKSFHNYINMPVKKWLEKDEFQPFINGYGNWGWTQDQTLLNWVIRSRKIPFNRLDWKFNALIRAVKKERISESYFVHFADQNKLPDRGENTQKLLEIAGVR